MHPDTIYSIYRAVILPKIMYGMGLIQLNKTYTDFINRQCRVALKQLLGISKHFSNDLNKLYRLETITITYLIENHKINFLPSLTKNETTSK